MIKGIEHPGLAANDPARLVEWYVKHLNMKVIKTNNKGTYFLQAPCGSIIEVYPASKEGDRDYDNYTAGWRHLAIEVEDFYSEYRKLLDNGIEIAAQPVIRDDLKLVLFKDCEGNLLHLVERKEPLIV